MGADRPVTVTAVADGVPTQEDAQAMLRTLPAQRFKLVVREEKREMAVYALTTGGGDRKPGRQLATVAADRERRLTDLPSTAAGEAVHTSYRH
jgi:uncharacterized protein (TIGR03435 family)